MRKPKRRKIYREADVVEFNGVNRFIIQDRRLSKRLNRFHGDVVYEYGSYNGSHFDREFGVGKEHYNAENYVGCVTAREGRAR